MNTEALRIDDGSLGAIHAGSYISWDKFVESNGLDISKIMSDSKYQKIVMDAYAMANFTQGAAEAASRLKPQNSRLRKA